MKRTLFFSMLFAVSLSSFGQKAKYQKTKTNYVPDEKTALKIAEAIWLPLYGDAIYERRPFKATLTKGVWLVQGYLPDTLFGGYPFIYIRKSDCKIISTGFPK